MNLFSRIKNANFKRFFKNLRDISKKYNKSFIYLVIDTAFSYFRYGVGLTDYLNYQFYLKKRKERLEYAGIKIQDKFYEIVSPSKYKYSYSYKPEFMKQFNKYTKRDFILPEEASLDDFKKFISKHKEFISKPYDGLGGASVKLEASKNIKNIEDYYDYCIKNRIFLEEKVKQHKTMNKLCSACCNTIRILTLNNKGKAEILWAGLRVGNGVNDVDNFHAGGMASEIDINTGKLKYNALDKSLNEYEKHPTSGIVFKDFEIPYFKDVVKLVKKAALESDKILVVGWDVAITDNGPLIIEGNRRAGFDLIQVAGRRGRMDIIKDTLNKIDRNI